MNMLRKLWSSTMTPPHAAKASPRRARLRRSAQSTSWLVPTSIAIAMAVGVLSAIAHHLFYSSLAGKPAPATDVGYRVLGTHVSKQQVNIIAGTAFAFLVKAALGVALSVAYVQLFWKALLHPNNPPTLATVDTAFSALSNTLALLKVWAWWRYPLLFGIALIAALLPLASIIPPATLSIARVPKANVVTSQLTVPNVAFESLNYVDWLTPADHGEEETEPFWYTYNGPSRVVQEIVQAVAAQGAVLRITPPAPNTTWAVDFIGPSLTCTNVTSSQQSAIVSNVARANTGDDCAAYGFLAWAPNDYFGSEPTQALPFNATTNTTYSFRYYEGLTASHPAEFWVGAFPNAMQAVLYGGHTLTPTCASAGQPGQYEWSLGYYGESTIVQCHLVNSSYHVHFDYSGEDQNITSEVSVLDDRPIYPVGAVLGPNLTWTGILSTDASDEEISKSEVDVEVLRTLSYQAILDAFNPLVIGTIEQQHYAVSPDVSTRIVDTVLFGASELQFLTGTISGANYEGVSSLQQMASASNETMLQSLVNNVPASSTQPIIPMVEKLFQDIVISMMSEPQLQPNENSSWLPPKADVTTYLEHNIYVYTTSRLWLAYGLAISCTCLGVVIGLVTMLSNGGTYTSDFSTVLRAVHTASLSVDVRSGDMNALGPLPSHLADANIWLPARSQSTAMDQPSKQG
jgi:hypothetical protein